MSLVVTLIAKSASAYQMRIEPLGQTKMVGGRMINRSLKLDLIPHVPLVFPQKLPWTVGSTALLIVVCPKKDITRIVVDSSLLLLNN